MPFVAKHRTTNGRIEVEHIPDGVTPDDLLCPLCDQPLFLRGGAAKVRRHFAHRFAECSADWVVEGDYRGGESIEHKNGKAYLAEKAAALFSGRPPIVENRFEVILETGAIKRIADVLVTFADGSRCAIECQLASITPETIQERTNDYAAFGVDVVWVLGNAAHTAPNRDWVMGVFGCVFTIRFTESGQHRADAA